MKRAHSCQHHDDENGDNDKIKNADFDDVSYAHFQDFGNSGGDLLRWIFSCSCSKSPYPPIPTDSKHHNNLDRNKQHSDTVIDFYYGN